MICISLQNKTYGQILEVLADPSVEMAEIRLDRCPLTDEEISELFSQSLSSARVESLVRHLLHFS